MNIVCVRTGTFYDVEYVKRLRDAVAPHQLFCVTDQPEIVPGVTNLPAPTNCTGWWTKCWLYSVKAPHPLLALDLDLVFLAPVDAFLGGNDYKTIRDFLPAGRRSVRMNGSITYLPRPYPQVWETFCKDQNRIETTYPTDQHYLWHTDVPWQFYPDSWAQSYRRGTVTPETKVLVFHGQPKPHEVGWTTTAQCPPE